jgi:hypothetical protein
MDLRASVEHAIHLQYRGDAGSISWLLRFAPSVEAWSVLPSLLTGSGDASVQFYAANGLYAKVCSEWTGLPVAAQASAYGALWAALGDAPSVSPLALRRHCLALAAAATLTRAAGTVTEFLRRALAPVAGLAAGGGGGAPLALACAELLGCLPDEAAERPLSGERADRVRREMLAASPEVLAALTQLLCAPGSPCSVAAAAGAGGAALASPGCIACLRALTAWLSLGGLTLGELDARCPGLLEAAAAALTLPGGRPCDAEVAGAAGEALEAALAVRVHPREAGRDAAVGALAGACAGDSAARARQATQAVTTSSVL